MIISGCEDRGSREGRRQTANNFSYISADETGKTEKHYWSLLVKFRNCKATDYILIISVLEDYSFLILFNSVRNALKLREWLGRRLFLAFVGERKAEKNWQANKIYKTRVVFRTWVKVKAEGAYTLQVRHILGAYYLLLSFWGRRLTKAWPAGRNCGVPLVVNCDLNQSLAWVVLIFVQKRTRLNGLLIWERLV